MLRPILSKAQTHSYKRWICSLSNVIVATNVRTGVSSAKISRNLTKIDDLYECLSPLG